MHRPGNRINPGLRSAVRTHHATGPSALVPLLDGATAGWHTAFAERLRGPLDPAALRAALDAVAARQDVLRYRIVQGAGIVDPPGPVPLHDDLADIATRHFDPAQRLWRAALHRTGPDEHVLAFVGHRAVFDERTQALLYAELAAAYDGHRLPPLPTGFAQYVAWRTGRRGPADLPTRPLPARARPATRTRSSIRPPRPASPGSRAASAPPRPRYCSPRSAWCWPGWPDRPTSSSVPRWSGPARPPSSRCSAGWSTSRRCGCARTRRAPSPTRSGRCATSCSKRSPTRRSARYRRRRFSSRSSTPKHRRWSCPA